MIVSQRKFLREYSKLRKNAIAGETITIAGRDGYQFHFSCNLARKPLRAPKPLPPNLAADFSSPAIDPQDWAMNQ